MTKTRVDPYSVSCDQCKAPIGFNCTYVHPRDWTPDSQRRFFNNKATEEQVQILQRAGSYTKQPHLARFTKAREQYDLQKAAQFQAAYGGGPRKILGNSGLLGMEYPAMLQWDYQPPQPDPEQVANITFNGQTFYPQKYIDEVLAEAHREWEHAEKGRMNRVRMEGYREGHSDGLGQGIEEGLRRAINMIATGSEDD